MQSPDTTTKRFKAGWVIDGSGRPAEKNRIIEVKEGTIQSIYPADCVNGGQPVVDLGAFTLLPGLIDCHVHLSMTGATNPKTRKKLLTADFSGRKKNMLKNLKQLAGCGVTAIRDGGDPNADVLVLRDEKKQINNIPVTIHVAGKAWHAKGRYGGLIGRYPDSNATLSKAVADRSYGLDHLKIVNSGLNSLTQFGIETLPEFDVDTLKKAIFTGESLGLKTMVHANGKNPVRISVEAGCHSIEHGFFMGNDNLEFMAEKQVFWTPTAVTMKAYFDYLSSQGAEKDVSFAQVSLKNLEHQLEQIHTARKAGVKVVMGTDAGCPGVEHGFAVKDELLLLNKAGYPVEQAIQCATQNGARLMGLDRKGALKKGMDADFIAVKSSPDDLLNKIDQIESVFIGGRKMDSIKADDLP